MKVHEIMANIDSTVSILFSSDAGSLIGVNHPVSVASSLMPAIVALEKRITLNSFMSPSVAACSPSDASPQASAISTSLLIFLFFYSLKYRMTLLNRWYIKVKSEHAAVNLNIVLNDFSVAIMPPLLIRKEMNVLSKSEYLVTFPSLIPSLGQN